MNPSASRRRYVHFTAARADNSPPRAGPAPSVRDAVGLGQDGQPIGRQMKSGSVPRAESRHRADNSAPELKCERSPGRTRGFGSWGKQTGATARKSPALAKTWPGVPGWGATTGWPAVCTCTRVDIDPIGSQRRKSDLGGAEPSIRGTKAASLQQLGEHRPTGTSRQTASTPPDRRGGGRCDWTADTETISRMQKNRHAHARHSRPQQRGGLVDRRGFPTTGSGT